MFKKILFALAMLAMLVGNAFAAVEINTADQAALDNVKGIGAVKSKAILDERTKNGPFKDWADFEKRVKGFAAKSTDALSKNGVTINGQAKNAAPAASTSASASAAATASSSAASKASAPASKPSASAAASTSASASAAAAKK